MNHIGMSEKLHFFCFLSNIFYIWATTSQLLLMPTGTIKFYNRRKGFGFIRFDESEKEIFVHATGLLDKRSIMENDKVSFEEKESEKGMTAVNVKKV